MRVLHVYKDVHPAVPGGIERHIDLLRRSVPGVQSSVLVCSRSRRSRVRQSDAGLEVAVGEFGRPLSTPMAPAFAYWLRAIEADVLHLHMPNPTGELAALAARDRRPMVASYHADIVRQAALLPVYKQLVDRVLDRSAAVVTGTDALRESSALLERHRARVDVIPYAVDSGWFDPAAVDPEAIAATRERYGRSVVLATGRLVYYKGFERLISIAPRLDAAVVIAGAGPLEQSLREQARRLDNVHFTGRVTDDHLRTLMATADVFVLPSVNRAESFGIATLEAQAMGTPAVVTDVGTGTVEAIEAGVTGLVVAAADDEALLDALARLLGDAALRGQMGQAARRRVVTSHDQSEAGARFKALYERVT